MSAQQLIDQVKSLPPEERKTFAILFEQFQIAHSAKAPGKPHVDWRATFERAAKHFQGRSIGENVILAARADERW